jgi:DNA-binding MarR family transcriptional regulator
MNDNTPQDGTYWLLIQLATRARHDLARIAEATYGLTPPQMQTLCLLKPATPSPMNKLSCQLACDASNVTGIADRLETQGLVSRKDDPADRRIKMIVLTDKGVTLRHKIMTELHTVAPDGIAKLSRQERDQFDALLAKTLLPQ